MGRAASRQAGCAFHCWQDTISELPRIVAFRNVLIHGYASVDDRIVWGVIEASLSSLRAALARLLAAD